MIVTVTETCSKLYIVGYVVVFWLNDILVSTKQRDDCYQMDFDGVCRVIILKIHGTKKSLKKVNLTFTFIPACLGDVYIIFREQHTKILNLTKLR